MDQQQITKTMLAFNKTMFDNTFKTIGAIQDQSESMFNSLIDKASWLPDDGKKAIADWISAYKRGREDFKNAAEDKYEKVTNYFVKQESEVKSKMKM